LKNGLWQKVLLEQVGLSLQATELLYQYHVCIHECDKNCYTVLL